MALVGKDELVHEVAERSGLEIAEAKRALEEMLGAIETQLGNGNEVRLTGFGKFSVSRRKAREGRNPQTGEPLKIAAKKVPHFSAGADLKKAVPPAPQEGASRSRSRPGVDTPRPQTSRTRPKRKRAADNGAPASGGAGSQDRASASSPGAEEGQSAETSAASKAASVAASGAKYALVAAAGLAVGAAGGLAVVNRR